AGEYLKDEDRRRSARNTLVALGYSEAINFSFVNQEADDEVSEYTPDLRLALENPIDETQSHMRTVLLGGLLKSLEHNFNRGTRNVRMFEIGKCFLDVGIEQPDEIERLALVATGARNETDWQAARVNLDFYDLKGAIELVGENLGIPPLDFAPARDIPYLHPGRAAIISLGGYEVGRIGQLHPRVGANYKFKQPVFVAELVLGDLLSQERAQIRYQQLPKFPAVIRDLALLIDRDVPYAEIEEGISDLSIPELVSVRLFDLYEGKDLPPGKHSIALSLRYQAVNRTLTDDEVNLVHERVVSTLKRRFAAEIR
ncbi:MAG: phenylalanine--tRNA ligase subunit beta, partial [Blastocatellia bacterium]|nr:phenylalanine--tRNA ligase subunit beta [Blastocatellia bacterium]